MTDTIYLPTPIEEKPEKDGKYLCCHEGKYEYCSFVKAFGEFGDISTGGRFFTVHPTYYSHWLKPVSKKEFVREIATKSWNTAVEWVDMVDNGGHFAPDLETYLNNL